MVMAEGMALWVDDMAPVTLKQIIGQQKLVFYFEQCIKLGLVPNITLAGAPGAGKTTLIKCFLHDLGYFDMPGQYEILNASDERGINMVREKLKNAAKKPTLFGLPRLIVLDEGDAITGDAQAAMRAVIEDYSSTTRFIIICNYPNELLEPIISRCPMKTAYPLTRADIDIAVERLKTAKNFTITADAVDVLYRKSRGDLRRFIGMVQDACIMSNFAITKEIVSVDDVAPELAKTILTQCLTNFEQARDVLITTYTQNKDMKSLIEQMFDTAEKIQYVANYTPEENELIARRVQDRIGEIDYRLTQGTNPLVQLVSILAYIRWIRNVPLTCPKAR